MKAQMPEKPKTMKGQIDALWDVCANHIITSLRWQDIKMNFLLGFLGLVMGLLAVIIAMLAS